MNNWTKAGLGLIGGLALIDVGLGIRWATYDILNPPNDADKEQSSSLEFKVQFEPSGRGYTNRVITVNGEEHTEKGRILGLHYFVKCKGNDAVGHSSNVDGNLPSLTCKRESPAAQAYALK